MLLLSVPLWVVVTVRQEQPRAGAPAPGAGPPSLHIALGTGIKGMELRLGWCWRFPAPALLHDILLALLVGAMPKSCWGK